MPDFVVGIVIEIQGKKYLIYRKLDSYYFDAKQKFDFKKFYQANYAIFEDTDAICELIRLEEGKILYYIYFSQIQIINNTSNIAQIWQNVGQNTPLSNIFFLEGGDYEFYNDKNILIDKLFISRKNANIGIQEQEIEQIGKIKFILYPSKIISSQFIEKIVNFINSKFPQVIIDPKGAQMIKKQVILTSVPNLNNIIEQLNIAKIIFSRKKNKLIIQKKNYNPIIHKISLVLENLILERGGFDQIAPEENIEVENMQILYNIPENQYLLGIIIFLKNKLNTKIFDTYINKLENLAITPVLDDNIPPKLLQNPIYYQLIELYFKNKKNQPLGGQYCLSMETFNNSNTDTDSIKSINNLYEIYCYLKFYAFLESIGIHFTDSLQDKIYNTTTHELLRYEFNNNYGFVNGFWKDKKVCLIYGDKITTNNSRKYQLFTNKNNLGFINEKFKEVTHDGLTPDISIEIGNKLIICDVKFSSFRDFDTKIDFPNPDYFISELHKYRRILINNEIINTPFIIFYPGEITKNNFEKYKLMIDLILKSYNMLLFPIYDINLENKLFYDYFKQIFSKIIG